MKKQKTWSASWYRNIVRIAALMICPIILCEKIVYMGDKIVCSESLKQELAADGLVKLHDALSSWLTYYQQNRVDAIKEINEQWPGTVTASPYNPFNENIGSTTVAGESKKMGKLYVHFKPCPYVEAGEGWCVLKTDEHWHAANEILNGDTKIMIKRIKSYIHSVAFFVKFMDFVREGSTSMYSDTDRKELFLEQFAPTLNFVRERPTRFYYESNPPVCKMVEPSPNKQDYLLLSRHLAKKHLKHDYLALLEYSRKIALRNTPNACFFGQLIHPKGPSFFPKGHIYEDWGGKCIFALEDDSSQSIEKSLRGTEQAIFSLEYTNNLIYDVRRSYEND